MKKVMSLILALVMVLSLVACGTGSSESTTPAAQESAPAAENAAHNRPTDGNGKIGFSIISLGDEFFSNLANAFQTRFEAAGYEVVIVSCEANAATQVSDLENLIAMDCEAIFFFAVDPDALVDTLIKAREAGIKVYGCGCTMDNTDAYDKIMNTDQYASGVGAAQLAADWINATFPDAEAGSVEVALITNTSSVDATKRSEGMRTIAELCDKATVVGEYDLSGASDMNIKSQEFAEMMQGQHPNLKAVVCYGCTSALGANEVYMRDANLNQDEFAVISVDVSQVVYENIAASMTNESLIRGTVSLGDDLSLDMWEALIDADLDYIDENKCVFKPVKLITPENVGEYLG